MKKLLGLILAFGSLVYANAAQTNFTSLAPSTINNLFPTNQLLIASIVVANTSTTNGNIAFFDSPRNVLLWTNSAYTSRVVTLGNVTNIYTNFLGVIETNAFTNVIVGGFVTNAGATNSYANLLSLSVAANSTVTYTPSSPLVTTYGLTATNNPNLNVTINYSGIR